MFTYCIWKAGMRHTLLPVLLTPPHNVFRHVVKLCKCSRSLKRCTESFSKPHFPADSIGSHIFLLHLENSYEIYFTTVAADTVMHRFRHAVKLYKGNQSLNRRSQVIFKAIFSYRFSIDEDHLTATRKQLLLTQLQLFGGDPSGISPCICLRVCPASPLSW